VPEATIPWLIARRLLFGPLHVCYLEAFGESCIKESDKASKKGCANTLTQPFFISIAKQIALLNDCHFVNQVFATA